MSSFESIIQKYRDYWAVQCKCYQEDAAIDKPKGDTFLSTSGKSFNDIREAGKKVNFAYHLWIDTTQKGFNREAESAIQNQTPQVGRIGYDHVSTVSVAFPSSTSIKNISRKSINRQSKESFIFALIICAEAHRTTSVLLAGKDESVIIKIYDDKSVIKWIMERYAITTHKESGIKNNPNDWARERGNPRYILDVLLSVITASIKTDGIVTGLPKVEWK
jgi:predicted helicase